MIDYDPGTWGLGMIWQFKGSVFPKACAWAMPNAVLAFLMHYFLHPPDENEDTHQMVGVEVLWSGYTFVLGFLVVFRNNQAYYRFWEGATLINQVRGEWFNAISCLVAFCNRQHPEPDEVVCWQNLLIRLGSLLYCSALQQVCALEDDTLEIIDVAGIDKMSLNFLESANDRCEILMAWMQRLIVEGDEKNILDIAPPILSRAYQELSRGIVNLNNVRKIKDIPFPFPYAQMITVMLIIHWFVTPLLAAHVIRSWWWAVISCFAVTGAFWCLIYIALEIDQPFGSDDNDLPITEMQRDFNKSLLQLLEPLALAVPTFTYSSTNKSMLRPSREGFAGLKRASSHSALLDASEDFLQSRSQSGRSLGSLEGLGKRSSTFSAFFGPSQAEDDEDPRDCSIGEIKEEVRCVANTMRNSVGLPSGRDEQEMQHANSTSSKQSFSTVEEDSSQDGSNLRSGMPEVADEHPGSSEGGGSSNKNKSELLATMNTTCWLAQNRFSPEPGSQYLTLAKVPPGHDREPAREITARTQSQILSLGEDPVSDSSKESESRARKACPPKPHDLKMNRTLSFSSVQEEVAIESCRDEEPSVLVPRKNMV